MSEEDTHKLLLLLKKEIKRWRKECTRQASADLPHRPLFLRTWQLKLSKKHSTRVVTTLRHHSKALQVTWAVTWSATCLCEAASTNTTCVHMHICSHKKTYIYTCIHACICSFIHILLLLLLLGDGFTEGLISHSYSEIALGRGIILFGARSKNSLILFQQARMGKGLRKQNSRWNSIRIWY